MTPLLLPSLIQNQIDQPAMRVSQDVDGGGRAFLQ
jgi:hypothetical protein